jgi:hypothetical protein
MKPNPHPTRASVRKRFRDTFDRENTDFDLGITADGSRWDAIRGVFRVLFNRAVSESSPSSYPMATVNMPYQDVRMSLRDIDSGVGAALWVTDSGNWWGIGLQQEEVPCNCSQGTQCDRWNAQNCSTWNSSNCTGWTCSTWSGSTSSGCAAWDPPFCTSGQNCRQWLRLAASYNICISWNACSSWLPGLCSTLSWNANVCTSNRCISANAQNCSSWNAQNCNRWFEFTFNCQTCYPQYIRIFRSINSTVSTVFSAIITKTFQTVSSTFGSLTLFVQSDLSAPSAKSMRVRTAGEAVSATVFSDTNLVNEIIVDEEIVYEPTGVQLTPRYGIIINPSSYNQKNYIGDIDINKA